MQPVVNPLSFDEHRDLGQEMMKSKARLSQLASVVASVYGPQSRPAFQFQKLNEALDRACEELSAQAEIDCPGLNASQFYR